MGDSIRLADLQVLGADERAQILTRLAERAAQPANGRLDGAVAAIRRFEAQYEMSSAQLSMKLHRGEIRETAEIAKWLFFISVRDRVERKARSKRTK